MADPSPLASARALAEQIEDKFFVAGQMDAQGHAAEKWKIGSGGAVLALSKRLLSEARADLTRHAADLAQAKAERDNFYQDYRQRCDIETKALHVALEQAQVEIARLREALTRYGQHEENCIKGQAGHPCWCGLDAALKEQP